MNYSRAAHTQVPDGSFWYYITFHKDEEDFLGTRLFLVSPSEYPHWYSMDTGEKMDDIDNNKIDAEFAKYFAKIGGGLDWYAN